MAILENGPDLDGELFPALIALVDADWGALALHLGNALNTAAMRADRTIGPKAGFDPLVGRSFVVESLGVENGLGHDARSIIRL